MPLDRIAPHFCHAAHSDGAGCAACGIPPIYDPGLSSDVIDCAERIATETIAEIPELSEGPEHRDLYRQVRVLMGRQGSPMRRPWHPTAEEGPTLDDESISAGIIRALNAQKGTRHA